MKKLFVLTAILVIAWSSVVYAQQQQPSPKNPEAPPVKLLLEVSYNPEVPPTYSAVLGTDKKAAWVWVTKFVRIPDKQMSPPIQAVKLESQYNGETADVRVTLLRGTTGFNQEDLVGTYHVGIGEQLTINDLRAVGVEPFKITLLNTIPPLPPPPTFENLTKSIEVVSVRAENMPKPSYKVTFRNLSEKRLRALRVEVRGDGRPATSSLLQGDEGRLIIEPGGAGEYYIPAIKTQPTATGYEPGTAVANTIVIRTAVLADMSFEGESESACLLESFLLGQRLWLKQVLPLIDQQLSGSFTDHIEAARQFKEKFSALSYDYTEDERNQASSVSPSCPKPAEHGNISPEGLKLEMLRDLDDIITKRQSPPINFKSWLETRRATYQSWLARL